MKQKKSQKFNDLKYIFARNIFLLTNGIIFMVCVSLYIFNDVQAAVFLGFILLLNITLGLAQDVRAWYKLEELQLLTSPRVLRVIDDKNDELVLVEQIKKGDQIKLKTGDQVPCDGVLITANELELNEGLITGESNLFKRKIGEHLLAGSIITSGTGVMRCDNVYNESRIARMTEGIKRYSVNMSPIQEEVSSIIKYSGYVLLVIIAYVFIHGRMANVPAVEIIKNIGALASIVVPQGLVFAMTLLFAYGAGHLFNRKVLLQEINATEKLGRIKNLCLDKTGTLTENEPVLEEMISSDGANLEKAKELMSGYLLGASDSSQTFVAISKYLNQEFEGKIIDTAPFSSWRAYGGVKMELKNGEINTILVGAPEVFLDNISNEVNKKWLKTIVNNKTKEGKRMLAIVSLRCDNLPSDIKQLSLDVVAVCVLSSKLRPGVRDAVDFFQKRGVRLRIISGDNPDTVQFVSVEAGVNDCDKIITGTELANWTQEDFNSKAKEFTIFARIIPEQKEHIIEALRKDGFTAMVGDGANDALAIKKADLGIAMFDGAPATRRIASVVLTNNSFTALPSGVELADSIIKNAEIFAGIFFNSAISGFLLFIILAVGGYPYQLTPLNVTLINYFVIGIPGILVSYWTIKPAQKVIAPGDGKFLSRVLPFIIYSSLVETFVIWFFFFESSQAVKISESNFLVVLAFILTGIIFFFFSTFAYRGKLTKKENIELWTLCIFELILLSLVLRTPIVLRFFEINVVNLTNSIFLISAFILILYIIVQFLITRSARENKLFRKINFNLKHL